MHKATIVDARVIHANLKKSSALPSNMFLENDCEYVLVPRAMLLANPRNM